MCDCFGRADVEVEELPPRYYGGRPVKRISFVRDIDRDYEDAYQRSYSRPRSSNTSMRQIEYRPSRFSKQKEDRDKDSKSQYKSPPKIDYPNSSRFTPLPPVIRESRTEEIEEPKKAKTRRGKKTYSSGQSIVLLPPSRGKKTYSSGQSIVVLPPSRGRRERRYYHDEHSDGDSWVGNSPQTEWREGSADSWAVGPVMKYSDTKRKGRSRSRSRGRTWYN